MSRLLLAALAVALSAVSVGAQTEDLTQREIEDALEGWRWRAGPLRLTPAIRVGGGVDSNALSQAGPDPVQDVTLVVGPGIRAVVPMGLRGLFEVYQETGYIFFRDLVNLRNVYNISRASGAIGGRDFLMHGNVGYQTGQRRPSSELDIPLDQDTRDLGAGIDIALGTSQQVNLRYDNTRFRFQNPEDTELDVSVPSLLDRSEESFSLTVERYLTAASSLVFDGGYDIIDYVDDSTERDGTSFAMRAGLQFSPRGDIRGQALFGYKRLEPDVPTQADFSGFVAAADVIYPLGTRHRLRGLFLRDTTPSILSDNWFYVETRFGASIDVYVAEKWYLRPGLVVGENTYPTATTFINADGMMVSEVVNDEFQTLSFSINYELWPELVVRVGFEHMTRDSNLPIFDKDRTVATILLTTDF